MGGHPLLLCADGRELGSMALSLGAALADPLLQQLAGRALGSRDARLCGGLPSDTLRRGALANHFVCLVTVLWHTCRA